MTSATSTADGPVATLHLEREIDQQPRLWRQVAAEVTARRAELDAFLAPVLGDPGARILLTGAGTSAFAGDVAGPALSRLLGRRVEPVATTDLVAAPLDQLTPDVPTLLVSFARSGDSPESVAATELADQVLGDVAHLVLTCNPDGQLARRHTGRPGSLVLLMPAEADDQSFAMTSSFTCMTLAVLLALGGRPDAVADTERLARAAEALLADRGPVTAVAALRPERVVYLGSGALLGLARESALKLVELTAGEVVTIADSPLGFRHGPKAVLTPQTVVVVYLSGDPHTRRYDLDIVAELAAQLGAEHVLAVDGSGDGSEARARGGSALALTGTAGLPDAWCALPAVVVAQLLGLTTSLARGHTPDNPFPTGEVNRVVQGVTLHPLTR
jgi:tagatose-6-phosphate ketose/aldose isomerase